MPTYEYKCLECDIQFEKFQGITAPPLEECPECNGKVKRLIGAGAGLIFKGSGFYTTDYRSEGYKKSAEKDKNASSDKSDKSKNNDKKEKKTDTSSESKTKSSDSD
ncbi:FmdB family transcriptional regulator [Candidatus Poribacteria bacterium]|nr:MAG: FmdB family transcriptional regulator [Candidatus Poribacteria bacterium]